MVVWFASALFFGVIVEAAVPDRAAAWRDQASAALFPVSFLSTFVLVWQGWERALLRMAWGLAGATALWFVAAASGGILLERAELPPETLVVWRRTLHALLAFVALGGAVWFYRLNPPSNGRPPARSGPPPAK